MRWIGFSDSPLGLDRCVVRPLKKFIAKLCNLVPPFSSHVLLRDKQGPQGGELKEPGVSAWGALLRITAGKGIGKRDVLPGRSTVGLPSCLFTSSGHAECASGNPESLGPDVRF